MGLSPCICVFTGNKGRLKIDKSCKGVLDIWIIPEKGSDPAFSPAIADTLYWADGFKIGGQIYKIDGSTSTTLICSDGKVYMNSCVNLLGALAGNRIPPYPVSSGTFINEPPIGKPAKPVK